MKIKYNIINLLIPNVYIFWDKKRDYLLCHLELVLESNTHPLPLPQWMHK